ncbi:hypothetical protein Pse7367_3656 (plasmid) [Thalassoporum mexicanum PCC 7367]|uniref:hypothetical protein n=1 Tax=Thalassoporum mexicanum TaxID=3457544 RepID=UPI00029FBD5F|nr:hypothetical protein [Pseudanabaena sp. PCC 7367]AFY71889.1 hypothetical protein Pse7367_3656 [Pseudanabaena sp. PCC 7367]
MDIQSWDEVKQVEQSFFDPDLLKTEYMQKCRECYYLNKDKSLPINCNRNYLNYLHYFNAIQNHREEHAKHFAKEIKQYQRDIKQCESIISEVIVYHYYIYLIKEGLIHSIDIETKECDLIIERCDGSRFYLEIFCIMPDPKEDENGVWDIQTHTQEAKSSIRQKLLRKAKKQKQFSKDRENFAVIEMNDFRIANDFVIQSSLSDGYKVTFNIKTRETIREGYDWSDSVFELPETRFLKGVIWFKLGNYQHRQVLINPRYRLH